MAEIEVTPLPPIEKIGDRLPLERRGPTLGETFKAN